MDDRLVRTTCIPLHVPDERIQDLHETYVRYQHCQQRTSDFCWPERPTQPSDLITTYKTADNALYSDLRTETDKLHANLV